MQFRLDARIRHLASHKKSARRRRRVRSYGQWGAVDGKCNSQTKYIPIHISVTAGVEEATQLGLLKVRDGKENKGKRKANGRTLLIERRTYTYTL